VYILNTTLYWLGFKVRVNVGFSFSALKFITSNDCIAEGVPSVELVRFPDVQFLSLEVGFPTCRHCLELKRISPMDTDS